MYRPYSFWAVTTGHIKELVFTNMYKYNNAITYTENATEEFNSYLPTYIYI